MTIITRTIVGCVGFTLSLNAVSIVDADTFNLVAGKQRSALVSDEVSALVMATDGSALINLTAPEKGVIFDIDSNGQPDIVSWTDKQSRVAFLAMDKNGDGAITNGLELVGRQLQLNSVSAFAALAAVAGRQRGFIDSSDDVFRRLQLWTDANHDGKSEANELKPAANVIARIGLGYGTKLRTDRGGNLFTYEGWSVLTENFSDRPSDILTPIYEVELTRARLGAFAALR